MKKTVAAVLAVVSVVGAGFAFRHLVDPYETVYRIADGDTFILQNNKQTIRLFGLDAPELDLCYGRQAMQRLDQLLAKRKVQLKEPLVDHFGRVVALVYVDGKLINEIMIREGFAAYRSEPGGGKEVMKTAHEFAKSHQLGIYSSVCTDITPPDPKCTIKGNHDQDRDDFVYLLPTCPHYDIVIIRRFEGDRWFCNQSEAQKAGFTISPDCNPATFSNPK